MTRIISNHFFTDPWTIDGQECCPFMYKQGDRVGFMSRETIAIDDNILLDQSIVGEKGKKNFTVKEVISQGPPLGKYPHLGDNFNYVMVRI